MDYGGKTIRSQDSVAGHADRRRPHGHISAVAGFLEGDHGFGRTTRQAVALKSALTRGAPYVGASEKTELAYPIPESSVDVPDCRSESPRLQPARLFCNL